MNAASAPPRIASGFSRPVQDAAQYLAVSVSTVYGWVWQRRIPFIKIGRAVRFDPRDLEAFIEASKQGYNTRAAGKG
jgi:excisionase family DNA binding protein